MKRLLAATCCVLVGVVIGITLLGTALHVGAVSPPTATQNGDTNGDGGIDISDAVYLLNYLFTGGGDIAEIQSPACPPRSGVVATGVTKCYGEAGPPIDCSAPKTRGQDGSSQLGCSPEGRFTDNGDGTISDACTGFIWTKNLVDTNVDGEITAADSRTWLEACQFAADMTYLGHDDWRVPNIQELLSIVNFGAAGSFGTQSGSNALLFPGFGFSTIDGGGTWSSTATYNSGERALAVGLNSDGGCDCCVVRNLDARPTQLHPFVAVRGPVGTP